MMSVIVKTDARQNMIQSAALLMRERGVDATSFSDVLAHSGAPRGSIYHHFPGGKAQLIEEATRFAGEFTAAGLAAAMRDSEPAEAVRGFVARWRKILARSGFGAGCPVVAAALEGDRAPAVRDAAAKAFSQWEELLADAVEPHAPGRGRSIATLVIASIEGAVVLARAERSVAPLERVAEELERVMTTALR
jgi:AcrR family transcriptional regulator